MVRRFGAKKGGHGDCRWVSFSPDGRKLATSGTDEKIRVWSLDQEQPLFILSTEIEDFCFFINFPQFSADGKTVAGLSWIRLGDLVFWDATNGKEVRTIHWDKKIRSFALSSDGKHLAALCQGDNSLYVAALETNNILHTLKSPPDAAKGGSYSGKAIRVLPIFSPDGRFLTAPGMSKSLSIWEVRTGKLEVHLQGQERAIVSAAFSPDNKLLASGGGDQNFHGEHRDFARSISGNSPAGNYSRVRGMRRQGKSIRWKLAADGLTLTTTDGWKAFSECGKCLVGWNCSLSRGT